MSGARLLDHWSPPDGAGEPVACLATSFTLEPDFFTQDCLARFLSLSTVTGEGDDISSLAATLEEEDRLSEAQVSVLVDRSTPAEKRNLRWDMLPVAVPRGGLLHAKVTVLVWERTARIVLGSPNLTSAGYRRQIELALTIDVDDGCQVPRPVLDELVAELRHLVGLVPGPATGGKGRALATIAILADRVENLDLPRSSRGDLRLAVAPARPGLSPLDRLADVWRGGQPLWATVLSPFWDDRVPAPAIDAIGKRLTGRPAYHRTMTLVATVDPVTGALHAPPPLAAQDAEVVAFDPPDDEGRGVHAKLLLLESDDWLAALIGSSNATEAGLGLHPQKGHHELNLWLGCPADSRTAEHMRTLACDGERIDPYDDQWEPVPDEDEPITLELPLGFVSCTIVAVPPPAARLELNAGALPASWAVETPAGHPLVTAENWCAAGSAHHHAVDLPDEVLPAYLVVRWEDGGEPLHATWTANVEDRSTLPPPAQLAELPVEMLLAALASTRPLPVALEHELRRRQGTASNQGQMELDPLRRFDDSGLLLKRSRYFSLALWRLQDRLARPVTGLDALRHRLHGVLGPVAIADGLAKAAVDGQELPGEIHFRLAELALTIAAVDWTQAETAVGSAPVKSALAEALRAIDQRHQSLPAAPDAALATYVHDAFEEAQRWIGS